MHIYANREKYQISGFKTHKDLILYLKAITNDTIPIEPLKKGKQTNSWRLPQTPFEFVHEDQGWKIMALSKDKQLLDKSILVFPNSETCMHTCTTFFPTRKKALVHLFAENLL